MKDALPNSAGINPHKSLKRKRYRIYLKLLVLPIAAIAPIANIGIGIV